MNEYERTLKNRLLDEFEYCNPSSAEQIAKQASKYREVTGDHKEPDMWIKLMKKVDYDSIESRWNWAVGFHYPPDFGSPKRFKV